MIIEPVPGIIYTLLSNGVVLVVFALLYESGKLSYVFAKTSKGKNKRIHIDKWKQFDLGIIGVAPWLNQ